MRTRMKKMIAPILISFLLVMYYALYFYLLIGMVEGVWKIVLGIIPLGFVALIVNVCMERIDEIRKGEEDDLSQY